MCTFDEKVRNSQAAGAACAIIYDYQVVFIVHILPSMILFLRFPPPTYQHTHENILPAFDLVRV